MAEEKKNIKFGQIGNALRSAASDHVTAVASDIFDEDSQKYQNAINAELDTSIKSEAQARTENDERLSSAISEERDRAIAAEEANATSIIGTDRIANGAVSSNKLVDGALIEQLKKTATFAGIATPSTNPGIPDGPVFYLTSANGVYVNFNNLEVTDTVYILKWSNGVWLSENTDILTKTHINATFQEQDANLSELKNEIYGKYIEQPNKSNVLHGYVGVDGTWNNNTFWCVFIPVDKLRGLKITQEGGLSSQYAFLKNKSTNYAVKNEFVEGGSRVDSKPENVIIPNDANFLYLLIATGDIIPEEYPTLLLSDKGIVKELEEIKGKTDILTNDVNELKSIGIEDKLQEVNTELATVNQEVDNLNATVEKIFNKSIAFYKESSAYTTKTQTASVFNFAEKEPVLNSMDVNSIVKHYGRNRFNIETAVFEVPSYGQYHSITKENGGVKIQCNVDYNGASTLVRTTYIAEFDGDLYVSTEADCVGLINDVAMIVHVNDVAQTRIYGKGLLYECVTVKKGDIVKLSLYTHINTTKVNTLFYKNIMFAYGGLYNYSEFKETESNLIKTSKILPTDADFYENSNTSQSGKYRINSLSLDFLPESVLPTSQDVKANIIVEGSLPLVTYNDVFQCTPGIGVANNGRISIYHDGEGRVQLCEWLKDNPITIKFDGEEYDINFSPTVQQGDILEFAIPSEVSYSYKKTIKDKTLVCFGDSITGTFDNNTDYPSMIAQVSDIHCYNVGFAGCQFTDHSDARYLPFSMNRLVDAIISKDFSLQDTGASQLAGLYAKRLSVLKEIDFSKIDFVTIFYGTNDWGSNKILESKDDGSITNKQRTNVEDAVNYCIDNLLVNYPNLKIIIITPYWRAIEVGKDSDVDANGRGDMLFDFSGKIAEISRKFNLPTIDLYHKFGANKYTNRYYTTDGTHPTEWAKHSIAHRIIDMINECS